MWAFFLVLGLLFVAAGAFLGSLLITSLAGFPAGSATLADIWTSGAAVGLLVLLALISLATGAACYQLGRIEDLLREVVRRRERQSEAPEEPQGGHPAD